MDISGYFMLNYYRLLMVISGYYINGYCGYFINDYSISGYCWLCYCKPLVIILLVAIDGY
jgi:hypothetical protein